MTRGKAGRLPGCCVTILLLGLLSTSGCLSNTGKPAGPAPDYQVLRGVLTRVPRPTGGDIFLLKTDKATHMILASKNVTPDEIVPLVEKTVVVFGVFVDPAGESGSLPEFTRFDGLMFRAFDIQEQLAGKN